MYIKQKHKLAISLQLAVLTTNLFTLLCVSFCYFVDFTCSLVVEICFSFLLFPFLMPLSHIFSETLSPQTTPPPHPNRQHLRIHEHTPQFPFLVALLLQTPAFPLFVYYYYCYCVEPEKKVVVIFYLYFVIYFAVVVVVLVLHIFISIDSTTTHYYCCCKQTYIGCHSYVCVCDCVFVCLLYEECCCILYTKCFIYSYLSSVASRYFYIIIHNMCPCQLSS